MNEDEEINEFVNHLIDKGAIQLHGMTEDGNITYKFDYDVLQKVAPELYEMIMEDIDEAVMNLYQAGLVEIEYDENLTAKFRVTEEGREYLKSMNMLDWYEEQ